MQHVRRGSLAAALIGVAILTQAARASVYYKMNVLVAPGTDHLVAIDRNLSMNDHNVAAFIGTRDDGSGRKQTLYSYDARSGTLRRIMNDVFMLPESGADPTQTFGPGVQITNQDIVVTRRYLRAVVAVGGPLGTITTAPLTYFEKWNALSTSLPTLEVMGDGGAQGAGPLLFFVNPSTAGVYPSPFNQAGNFAAIFPHVSLNNVGQPAFAALSNDTKYYLVTHPNLYLGIQTTGFASAPSLSDAGTVTIKSPSGTLYSLPYDFSQINAVVNAAAGFTNIGPPSYSDDGKAIAFYADVDLAHARPLGTYAGPGIFLAIREPTRTVVMRVAGQNGSVEFMAASSGNHDGVCDANETCIPAGELGFSDALAAIDFASFDPTSQVAVTSAQEGSYTVAFVGTPNSPSRLNPRTLSPFTFRAVKGLYSVQVDAIYPLSNTSPSGAGVPLYKPNTPILVAQVGDVVGGLQIADLAVYDGLSVASTKADGTARVSRRGDHRIAFWVNTLSGDAILSGERLDSDQDGLADHWETNGLDVDGDGVVDLSLAAWGADPNVPDIFLELDWAAPQGNRDYAPVPETIQDLVVMFANGGAGTVSLHVDAGPRLSVNTNGGVLDGGEQVANAWVPYLGVPGAPPPNEPNATSLDIIKRAHCGGLDKSAREFVFHYGFIGDHLGGNVIGQAEAWWDPWPYVATSYQYPRPGNDFVIGQEGKTYKKPWPRGFNLTQTMAHELGHTLGLRHGGTRAERHNMPPPRQGPPAHDPNAYDPRYLSLMSYAYSHELGGNALTGTSNSVVFALQYFAGLLGTANLAGKKVLVIPNFETRTITSNNSNSLTVSGWNITPAANDNVYVLLRDYSRAGDPVFNDWANLRMDFTSVAAGMFNSMHIGTGSLEVTGDMPLSDAFVDTPSIDSLPPSIAIVSPADSLQQAPGTFSIQLTASDDRGVDSVRVLIDTNGDGIQESLAASPTGPSTYSVSPTLSGAWTQDRTYVAEVVDVAGRRVTRSRVVRYQSTTGVGDAIAQAAHLTVSPNPFVGTVAIDWTRGTSATADVCVFDLQGRLVRRLVSASSATGSVTTWDGRDDQGRSVPAGIYLVRLQAGMHEIRRRLLRLQ